MKILFLTIGQIQSLQEKSVHIDIIKGLSEAGHQVSVLATREKRLGLPTEFVKVDGVEILRLRIGNLTKCSIIKKGINTLLIEKQFINAVKKYYATNHFDLVIYNTPPITLAKVVKYCKKKYQCQSYLMLKDIFPQNAVDIGLMSKDGIMGIMYKMFRKKEKDLYKYSDRIGCMSQANVDYILEHNQEIDEKKLEIFPNAVHDIQTIKKDKSVLQKYGIDTSKITFIYGGNLGRPQGLDFLADALHATQEYDCNFVIAGSGQDKEKFYAKIKNFRNVYVFDYLPHKEYNQLCASCDVGMVVLDYRFTIPNYPSRTLSYMQNAIPMLACTDYVTDIKELVEVQANCGKWCYSNDVKAFCATVQWFIDNQTVLHELGENGYNYLKENFMVTRCVKCLEHFVRAEEMYDGDI